MATKTTSDPSDVVMTATAKSKCHRLLSAFQVREAVSHLHGTLYRRGGSNEYHLVHDDYAFSLRPEGNGEIVVVTQMHIHVDYERLDTYREVDGFEVGSND